MSALVFEILLSSLVLLRFFIETVKLLPESFTYAYDGLLLVGLVVMLAPSVRRTRPFRSYGLLPWIALFTLVWTLSVLLNRDIHALSATAFLIMHLEGVLWFLVLANLNWDERQITKAFHFIIGVGLLELALAALQIPYALHASNPDLVVGTFGQNNSQFAFFLTVFTSMLLSAYSIRYMRTRWLLLLLPWSLVVFFAIGFRAMWLSFPLTCGIVLLLGTKIPRKTLVSLLALIIVGCAIGIAAVGQQLKVFSSFFSINFTDIGKIRSAFNVADMYAGTPHTALIGCGPATFSSRSWSTFTRIGEYGAVDFSVFDNPNWGKAPGAGLAIYRPGQFASRYTMDLYRRPYAVLGSMTTDGPFSSYISVLAEVGLLGALGIFGAYVCVLYRLWRVVRGKATDHPLPKMFASAAIGGFLMLAQMCVFDNWLEVGRVTVLMWSMAALAIAFEGFTHPDVPQQA